ncbi:MAG: phosphoglucosamine mutase [Eubacteriales bacterium]|nr:phosphoglucosamine mutase [Eubacteriales bacterium]
MGRIFGTDGVRGIANKDLTPQLAFKLGQAGALALSKKKEGKPVITVGKDTRISSDMLEASLAAGICSVGAEVILLGTLPTPAVAYLTRKYGADAGVVISASHNPMEYNGIKFFNNMGYKLPDAVEDEIEKYLKGECEPVVVTGSEIGQIIHKPEGVKDYQDYAQSTVGVSLEGMHIALDCANGAASGISPKVFENLGAKVTVINDSPDGTNINLNCGSTHMGNLQALVKEIGADMGLAFDGDADRVLAVDENGKIVDGDEMMSICGIEMNKKGTLNGSVIVATVMSNLGLHIMAKNNSLNIETTAVGDRYVLEKMLECDYKLGGEQSGHIIFLDYNTTGDGLVTGLQLVSIVAKSGKKLSQLASVMKILPQVLINAKVQGDKNLYKKDEEIMSMIADIEKEFDGEGRVLIRPSGTEPLVRVMIEGNDIEKINLRARQLSDLIEKKLG